MLYARVQSKQEKQKMRTCKYNHFVQKKEMRKKCFECIKTRQSKKVFEQGWEIDIIKKHELIKF